MSEENDLSTKKGSALSRDRSRLDDSFGSSGGTSLATSSILALQGAAFDWVLV